MVVVTGKKGEDLEKKIKQQLFKLDENVLYDIEIEKHREKRSNNANSYCWVLCTKIADLIGSSKEEVYFQELKKYGQSMLIPITPNNKVNGYFKYYEYQQRGLLNHKECDWYIVYKGSSSYNTREMAVLLNGIVSDCKELDIPTLEDYRIQQLIDDWEK